jgi:hypothetical protein
MEAIASTVGNTQAMATAVVESTGTRLQFSRQKQRQKTTGQRFLPVIQCQGPLRPIRTPRSQ